MIFSLLCLASVTFEISLNIMRQALINEVSSVSSRELKLSAAVFIITDGYLPYIGIPHHGRSERSTNMTGGLVPHGNTKI